MRRLRRLVAAWALRHVPLEVGTELRLGPRVWVVTSLTWNIQMGRDELTVTGTPSLQLRTFTDNCPGLDTDAPDGS